VTVAGEGAAVQVQAEAAPQVSATAQGYGGALLASVGVSLAKATATPTVEASVGTGGSIAAKSLEVKAIVRQNGTDYSAQSRAVAGGGALIGVNATQSTASTTAIVTASLGSALNVDGDVDVLASTTTKQEATVSGLALGLVAAGAHLADVEVDTTTRATVANTVTGTVDGTLSVDATGNDDSFAGAVAGSGGVVAGAAAKATTDSDSETVAKLGGGNTTGLLTAQAVAVEAQHTTTFNGQTNSLSAGLLGASGAIAGHDVDATVTADLLAGAKLQTYDLTVLAQNNVRKPWLADGAYNAFDDTNCWFVDITTTDYYYVKASEYFYSNYGNHYDYDSMTVTVPIPDNATPGYYQGGTFVALSPGGSVPFTNGTATYKTDSTFTTDGGSTYGTAGRGNAIVYDLTAAHGLVSSNSTYFMYNSDMGGIYLRFPGNTAAGTYTAGISPKVVAQAGSDRYTLRE
jgi:hypothetical protein